MAKRVFLGTLIGLIGLFAVGAAALAAWLFFAPPELIRVGSGYAAKIVCSNVFLAGRNPDAVLRVDVQAPGHPLLRLMSVTVDRERHTVEASLLGRFGRSIAVARDGLGCASVPDGDVAGAASVALPASRSAKRPDALWPQGNRVEPDEAPGLIAILNDPRLTGPGMRAIVVVQDGRIVGERYADGFASETPLIGWSMSKTINAALIGTLVKTGRLAVDRDHLLPEWSDPARAKIRLADLMAMTSGLAFDEDYGTVADVTRMLYLEPDMAAFAAAKPLTASIGSVWSYSSGTSVLLSRIWQTAVSDPVAALDWPRRALFEPLGMASAVLEADEAGTLVGASYVYATARDWARFGQFLLQDGAWNGTPLLPPGFVAFMREPVPASHGLYAKGQLWLKGSDAGTPPGGDPDHGFSLPSDTFWMLGHDGQSIAVVPSRRLVVVRLGLTPDRLGYKAQALVQALIDRLD